MFFLFNSAAPIYSRSGARLPDGQGSCKTGVGPSPVDSGKPQVGRGNVHRVHGTIWGRSTTSINPSGVCLPGVPGPAHTRTRDNTEQTVSREGVFTTGRTDDRTYGTPKSADGPGCPGQGQDIHPKDQVSTPGGEDGGRHTAAPGHGPGKSGVGRGLDYVLWHTMPVGSGAALHGGLRQVSPPNQGRHHAGGHRTAADSKMGKESSEGGTIKDCGASQHPGLPNVPGSCTVRQHHRRPDAKPWGSYVNVPGLTSAHPCLTGEKAMGSGPPRGGGGYSTPVTPQYQKNFCVPGSLQRMLGLRNTETRRLEIHHISDIYRHPNWQGHGGLSGLCR